MAIVNAEGWKLWEPIFNKGDICLFYNHADDIDRVVRDYFSYDAGSNFPHINGYGDGYRHCVLVCKKENREDLK